MRQRMEVLSDPIRLPGSHDQTVCPVVVPLDGLAEVGDGDQGLGLGHTCINDHRFGVLVAALLRSFDPD